MSFVSLCWVVAERCERLWARALGLFHVDAPLPGPAAAAVRALRVACFSNMAASRARVGDKSGVREATDEALKIDPYVKTATRNISSKRGHMHASVFLNIIVFIKN